MGVRVRYCNAVILGGGSWGLRGWNCSRGGWVGEGRTRLRVERFLRAGGGGAGGIVCPCGVVADEDTTDLSMQCFLDVGQAGRRLL